MSNNIAINVGTVSSNVIQRLADEFNDLNLSDEEKKKMIQRIVATLWPELPPYSTLDHAVIEEVQKATVGSGVVLTFVEGGKRKAVLLEAGEHYKDQRGHVMIPGGFINLSDTPGSIKAKAKPGDPEDPAEGAAREIEEEMRVSMTEPLLSVKPDRLLPVNSLGLKMPWGERRIVIGHILELNAAEVKKVKEHIARMSSDKDYRDVARNATINPETDRPEADGVKIVDLDDLNMGQYPLVHEDQANLFKEVAKFYSVYQLIKPKLG